MDKQEDDSGNVRLNERLGGKELNDSLDYYRETLAVRNQRVQNVIDQRDRYRAALEEIAKADMSTEGFHMLANDALDA